MLDRQKIFRLLILTALLLAGSGIFLLILQHIIVPIVLWFAPSTEGFFYDWGAFGAYRPQSYVSFNLSSPRTNIVQWDDSCSNGYVFLNVNGPSVTNNAPMILDSNGELVWMSMDFPTTMNNKVQRFQGKDYMTFWGGKKAATSGLGDYFMLDSNYQTVRMVDAVGDQYKADLHEFKITENDTALMTVYNTTQHDLTAMGMHRDASGWMVENLFQEIDIATGKLLFEWKASDHFRPEETYMTNPVGGYRESIPFDTYHLNSIDKDSKGNYLVSARHLHAIFYIDGKSGEVLWTLGGHSTDFEDLSDGHASDFKWQHDARWMSEEDGIISLFDNGIAWPHMDAPYSSARIIQLDVTKKTAKLLHSLTSLQHARSSSQGSVQLLQGSAGEPHIFTGWGSSAVYTEHTVDGQLLCETHFGASAYYFWERVKSYRAFKTTGWKSIPSEWDPSAKIQGDRIYVSWNGATEVATWTLEGTHDEQVTENSKFEEVDVLDKRRFEESFELPGGFSYYRVVALDQGGKILRHSNIESPSFAQGRSYSLATFAAVVCIIAVVGFWLFRKRGLRWESIQGSILPLVDRSKYQKIG